MIAPAPSAASVAGSAVTKPLRGLTGSTPRLRLPQRLPLNVLEPCNGVQGTAGA